MNKNGNDNWVEGIAEFAEKLRLEKEYPEIDWTRLGIAVGVVTVLLTLAAIIL